jgi:hypothetical protein
MKIFTKIGIALLVMLMSSGIVMAQMSAIDFAPKKVPIAVPPSDAQFDLQFEWPVGVGDGEAGIETDGNYIYTSKWNGAGEFRQYGMDGTYLGDITVPGSTGCRDIAYDGTYFYGGAASTTVFQMDIAAATMVSTFTAPTAVRAIAYNENEDVFFLTTGLLTLLNLTCQVPTLEASFVDLLEPAIMDWLMITTAVENICGVMHKLALP